MHPAEPLVLGPSQFEVAIAIASLKIYYRQVMTQNSRRNYADRKWNISTSIISLIPFGIRKHCLVSGKYLSKILILFVTSSQVPIMCTLAFEFY
jgi:hypothetical protein